jgi:hypothetical protein
MATVLRLFAMDKEGTPRRNAVDTQGHIAQSVQESARLGMEILGSRALVPPEAPRGRDRFLERQHDAFFWRPTPEQERAIGRMIYGGSSRSVS